MVEGIEVFAVRTLPQAVDLINAPESFTPLRVDARGTMLADAAQYAVDMRDVFADSRPPSEPWKLPAPVDTTLFLSWPAGRWKNDAGQAHSHDLAADVSGGSH